MSTAVESGPRVITGDQRLEVIITTAAQMFYDKGYRAISIRDLAAAVGIQMSSLYYYFPSKDDILYRIIKRHWEHLLEATEETELSGSAEERLRRLLRRSVVALIDDRLAGGVSTNHTRDLGEAQVDELRVLSREYEDRFRRVIEEGIDSGEFIKCDVGMAVYLILGALSRLNRWYREGGRLSVDEIAAEYEQLLVRGLLACP